ncbi:unnamed protein product [Soboliphyme baturini]|uniref:Tetratricopeptide repeat protein n=1 Tax=Soboliphyme baturini TaxID=241478 RepID=A0A183IF84_9BILA|nr:unnamed protein product [Soboliphyme baturini]
MLCKNADSCALEKAIERYKKLLDLYQEQPQVLKPVSEKYFCKLLSYVLETSSEDPLYDESFKYMRHLTKVFGYKWLNEVFETLKHD